MLIAPLSYLITSILIIFSGRFFFKNTLHPLVLGSSLWFFLVSIACYEPWFNNYLQSSWSINTYIVMWLGGLSFLLPAFIFPSIGKYSICSFYFPKKYIIALDLLALLNIIAFILRFKEKVFMPTILFAGTGTDIKELVPAGILGLHYIDLLTPIIGICYIYEFLFSKKITLRRKLIILIYTLFTISNLILYKVSRDELTQYISGVAFLFIIGRPKQRVKIMSLISIMFIGIIFMTISRLSDSSAVFTQFDGPIGNILSIFYTYTAYNFENVNKLVNSEFHDTYIWASGKFLLRFIYPYEYDNNQFGIILKESTFFNARTYLYMFYHDLRFLGVFMYSFLIGSIIQFFYRLSIRNTRYLLMIAVLIKGVLFLSFGNFFFADFPYFFVYPVTLIFTILLFRKIT
ncbi:O-antigen polymerase [Providencia manganoxydans]|uniref:O-antigen polymerase n=1 Tax=Providencia manganoxydans TaxID=2923283 RepID=UPI0034E55B3D